MTNLVEEAAVAGARFPRKKAGLRRDLFRRRTLTVVTSHRGAFAALTTFERSRHSSAHGAFAFYVAWTNGVLTALKRNGEQPIVDWLLAVRGR